MIQQIDNEELEFMLDFHYPVALIECLFSDFDNLILCEEDRFSEVRLAQLALLSYEYIQDYNPKKSQKENFRIKEMSGSVFCFGGRKFGKTLILEILDLLISMILNDGDNCGFSSFDAIHIRGVLEKVIQVLENHEFLKMFEAKINRSPSYRLFLKNGYSCEGINMNLASTTPGEQFFQKHLTRLYLEEASFETTEVYKKRQDSISELGCVYRIAGMTNFTKYKPAGLIFYDMSHKSRLVNFPQYVNPRWDDKAEQTAIKHHSGKDSISYRIFVKGEIVEDGVSAMDMERVRKNYNPKKQIKHIEINKDNFSNFEAMLILERPSNATTLYIAADIGENVSELVVINEVNTKYQYRYNITLYGLTDKEQEKIFKYLAQILNANIVALDTTEGMARAIYRSLELYFPKENLTWVGFNEKIKVAIDKDDNGREIFIEGKPVWKEEFVDSWSIKRLRDLLYEEGKFDIPMDYKLDTQLNSIVSTQSGIRTLYSCLANEDHLLAAWRVFAIAEWLNYLNMVRPIQKKLFSKVGV